MVIWVAYYTDWSGFAVFDSELEALRYAVDSCMMKVAQVKLGQDIRQQVEIRTTSEKPLSGN